MSTTEWVSLSKPLPAGTVHVQRLRGTEGISELFHFELEFVADSSKRLPFEQILGKPVSLKIEERAGGHAEPRYLHGLASRFSELGSDESLTRYRMSIAPALWLLTKRIHCRVFQQKRVVQVLEQLLKGLKVNYKLLGSYHEHNYVVQYGESDFAFACRIMEEEGIFYYFTHDEHGHTLQIADTSSLSPELPGEATIEFGNRNTGSRTRKRIYDWQTHQQLCAASYRVWDHSFELPSKNLEAVAEVAGNLMVGTVTHRLNLGADHQLETFAFPGEYAHRFDGVTAQGSEQASNLQTIFQQNHQTAQIRIQEEAAGSLVVEGRSDCRQLAPGYQFTLSQHPHASGKYLLARVEHDLHVPSPRSGNDGASTYTNRFECLPIQLPFRPRRGTPRPTIHGLQSATVVGPEEIFTDKYGRVKVQFRWDRYGKNDENSSCWLRVAKTWAGGDWGHTTIPRVGQEVLVAFLEGDPDAPIIVGSVHNAGQMPPYTLPDNKTISGIKTHSSGGSSSDFHGLAFDDTSGKELVQLRSQKDMVVETKSSHSLTVPQEQVTFIGGTHRHIVGGGVLFAGPSSGSGGGWENEVWDSISVGDSIGTSFQSTFGIKFGGVLGTNESAYILRNNEMTFDPITSLLALKGEDLPASLIAVGSILSHSEWLVGQQSSLYYGIHFESVRGAKFQYSTNDTVFNNTWLLVFTAIAAASNLALTLLPALEPDWTEDEDNEVYLSLWLLKVIGQFLCGYLEASYIVEGQLSLEELRLQEIDTRINDLTTEATNATNAARTATTAGQNATATSTLATQNVTRLTNQTNNIDATINEITATVQNLKQLATTLNNIANGNYQLSTQQGSIKILANNPNGAELRLAAGTGTNAGNTYLTAGGACYVDTTNAHAFFGTSSDTGYGLIDLSVPYTGMISLNAEYTSVNVDGDSKQVTLQAISLDTNQAGTLCLLPTAITSTVGQTTSDSCQQIAVGPESITLGYGATASPTAYVKIDSSGITLTAGSTSLTITSSKVTVSVNGGSASWAMSSSGITEIISSLKTES